MKFTAEEFGIAAYIKTYIHANTNPPFSFVDMGCGNGLLTFALTSMGAAGFGMDVRPRKLWQIYPELGTRPDLRVGKSLVYGMELTNNVLLSGFRCKVSILFVILSNQVKIFG